MRLRLRASVSSALLPGRDAHNPIAPRVLGVLGVRAKATGGAQQAGTRESNGARFAIKSDRRPAPVQWWLPAMSALSLLRAAGRRGVAAGGTAPNAGAETAGLLSCKRVHLRVQDSWSKGEVLRLRLAVQRHGRDWKAVSCDVGSKSSEQCMNKVIAEVNAGRMAAPGGKHVQNFWSKAELLRLEEAVRRHGRDWIAVSCDVGSTTRQQCQDKVTTEVRAGRMQEPGGKDPRRGKARPQALA